MLTFDGENRSPVTSWTVVVDPCTPAHGDAELVRGLGCGRGDRVAGRGVGDADVGGAGVGVAAGAGWSEVGAGRGRGLGRCRVFVAGVELPAGADGVAWVVNDGSGWSVATPPLEP